MSARLPAFVPKAILIALVGLLLTAGLTYAAEQQLATTPAPAAAPTPVQKRATLVVPDLRRQAFVFAKGQLQDAGFAWRVVGGVHGYAANVVVDQQPAAGAKLFDTGAPVVKLTLSRNRKYAQVGAPEDISPYRATAVQRADLPATPAPVAPATTTTAPAPAATTTPAPAATTTPAPAATTPAPAATTATTAAPEQAAKPAAKPAAAKPRYPQSRPAAFAVAGAPKEPLDEMPLVDRANALGKWLAKNPKPTDANVRHWLYQNEWIVTGAKFGWWRGTDALKVLVAVDRHASAQWGIGSKSEAAAVRALTEVEARSR
jgi:hypothetical protein